MLSNDEKDLVGLLKIIRVIRVIRAKKIVTLQAI